MELDQENYAQSTLPESEDKTEMENGFTLTTQNKEEDGVYVTPQRQEEDGMYFTPQHVIDRVHGEASAHPTNGQATRSRNRTSRYDSQDYSLPDLPADDSSSSHHSDESVEETIRSSNSTAKKKSSNFVSCKYASCIILLLAGVGLGVMIPYSIAYLKG